MTQNPHDSLEPFRIRSHHLTELHKLASIVEINIEGGIVSKQTKDIVIRTITRIVQKYIARTFYKASTGYTSIDTVGKKGEGAQNFYNQLRAYYLKFLELPANYPVIIQSTVRDDICKACYHGNHCNQSHGSQNDDNVLWDFLDNARRAGINFDTSDPSDHATCRISMGDLRRVCMDIGGRWRRLFEHGASS